MMSRTTYSDTSATTPAPTVRPPSRIANRNSFSIPPAVTHSLARVTLALPHLRARRPRGPPLPVRPPKTKLRAIPIEKRRVPPPLLLPQHVHLRLELLVRRDTPRLRQHLPPLPLVLVHPPQQRPNVVPRPPLVQQLPKHLHPRHHRLPRVPKPHDLDLVPHLHDPALHPPRHHRPPPRARENVPDRHQKPLSPPPPPPPPTPAPPPPPTPRP